MWYFGVVKSVKVTENSATLYAYEFLLALHNKHVPVLHRFWDIARYGPKIADFNPPHLYMAPPLGWPWPTGMSPNLLHQKTRIHGHDDSIYGVAWVILSLAVLELEIQLVSCDRQTDGHDDSILAQRRAVKMSHMTMTNGPFRGGLS